MKKKKKIIDNRKLIQLLASLPVSIMIIQNFKYSTLLLVLVTAVAGAFYCGYLCPFGFLQEIIALLSIKLKIKRKKIPKSLNKYLLMIRYIMFILISLFSLSIIYSLIKYDPRSNLYLILTGKTTKLFMAASIVSFCILSLFYNKIFCRYFCIKGAEFGLLSFFRIFAIKRDELKCINCKRCDKACTMEINISKCNKYVNSFNCINCFECIKKCPVKNTLKFGIIIKKTIVKKIIYGGCFILIFLLYNKNIGFQNDLKAVEKNIYEEKIVVNDTIDDSKNLIVVANTIYYEGVGAGFNGNIKVKVGIENEKIKSIVVLSYEDDLDWYLRAKDGIIPNIIEKQSADVDIVTGATYSSQGIIEAVRKALIKWKAVD